MNSTLDDKLMKRQIQASLDELFSNREAGVNPADPPASMKAARATLATIHRLADWRYVALVGFLLVASISVAAWWWSSSAHTAKMAPTDPAPLTQAAQEAVTQQTVTHEATAPKDAAPTTVARSSDLAQQLQPMTRDLAALRQAVERLEARQEQLGRDNENVASQLKASQEEMARKHNIIEQIRTTQIQMARESETVTERLNAIQEQPAPVIANASEPKVTPEEPKVMPEIPLPRPRQLVNMAQTQKPTPTPARPHAKKPQPSLAWPWSAR